MMKATKEKHEAKKAMYMVIGYILLGIGASLAMRVNIGVSPYDAMIKTISDISGFKVGYVSAALNMLCIVIQIAILKSQFKPRQFLQVFMAILLGYVINFFYYGIWSLFALNSYIVRIIILLVAYFISATGISIILKANFINVPFEGCNKIIADKFNIKFGRLRQCLDFTLIFISLLLAFLFKTNVSVREGTVIGMIVFGPLFDFLLSRIKI